MQHPPPNRNQPITPNYFQQLALTAPLGDETSAHQHTPKRARIALDRNALISLAVIFLVILISAGVVGIYNGQSAAKALPNEENAAVEQSLPKKSGAAANGSDSGDADRFGAAVSKDANGKLVVYVSGAVVKPGVVTVKSGARIDDAVKAAGGALPEADLARVNLAQLIHDGEQIHLPKVGEAGNSAVPPGVQGSNTSGENSAGAGSENLSGSANTDATASKIDLNQATSAQLEEIPGIGPVTAGEIISWREQNGAFQSIDDLLQISGIGEKTLEKIRPHVSV